jgi:tRNA threonylcarbamoyl adenosine modification protein YjeE
LENIPNSKKSLLGLIINAGELPHHPPSSVVDTTLNEPTILRQGEVDFNQLGAKTIITNSPEETQKFARKLLKKHLPALKEKALLFALQGKLGAGKTQFAKGLGQGLKIAQPITSPTFVIVKEYPYELEKINGIFYHIDVWRTASSPTTLKFIKEYLQPGNIIAIEWIQKSKEVLEKLSQNSEVKITWVEIQHLGQTKRQIRIID